MSQPDIEHWTRTSRRTTSNAYETYNTSSALKNTHPYASSIASSASSSNSSIFSGDARSSQSSAPSSAKSASLVWEQEQSSALNVSSRHGPSSDQHAALEDAIRASAKAVAHRDATCPVVPAELRSNPRRTQTAASFDSAADNGACRPPPSLIRQCDRKDNFVESLVDTTTQMIEVIWPLSILPCGRDAVLGNKNLIGLRTFIQEVLKRSKTSYSTLQVALYYLVLIKPWVPKIDSTREQVEDFHATRAMQCGRRMFLAALILASKYLQDRNYSARAWSKISGLKVCEINANELAFLKAVNWNLHVPEPHFKRWTDIVLKFSIPSNPARCSTTYGLQLSNWRAVIPRLTPELDEVEIDLAEININKVGANAQTLSTVTALHVLPVEPKEVEQPSKHHQPPTISAPIILEPTPCLSQDNFRFPPSMPRISQLPTPQMTPRTNNFCTPAASVGTGCPAISALSKIYQQGPCAVFRNVTSDCWPGAVRQRCVSTRQRSTLAPPSRGSYARTESSSSFPSPQSMISDHSSQSSRSSRSSSVCELPRPIEGAWIVSAQECSKAITSSPISIASDDASSPVSDTSSVSSTGAVDASKDTKFLERDAIQALMGMHTHSSVSLPEADCQQRRKSMRKRERPLSICEVPDLPACYMPGAERLQFEITKELEAMQNNEDEGAVVIPDLHIADSFVLAHGFKLPALPQMPQRTTTSQLGMRKKTKTNQVQIHGLDVSMEALGLPTEL